MRTKNFIFALMSLFVFSACDKNEPAKEKDVEEESNPKITIAKGEKSYMILSRKKSGETIKLWISVPSTSSEDEKGIWIDLNGNGKKDGGEDDINFLEKKEYTISSKTIVVYGKIGSFDCSNNELTGLDVSNNKNLTSIECAGNQLSSLDLSKNKNLTSIDCSKNKLRSLDVSNTEELTMLSIDMNEINGKEMDNIVNSLPNRTTQYSGVFFVSDKSDPKEKNAITEEQAKVAEGKNWTVMHKE